MYLCQLNISNYKAETKLWQYVLCIPYSRMLYDLSPFTFCETCDYIKQRKDDLSSITAPATKCPCPAVQGLLDATLQSDRAAFVW